MESVFFCATYRAKMRVGATCPFIVAASPGTQSLRCGARCGSCHHLFGNTMGMTSSVYGSFCRLWQEISPIPLLLDYSHPIDIRHRTMVIVEADGVVASIHDCSEGCQISLCFIGCDIYAVRIVQGDIKSCVF